MDENKLILLIANIDVELFKELIEGMSECLEKSKPYKSLLIYKEDEERCFFITNQQIFVNCVNENFAPALSWGTQENVDYLSKHFLEYEYEGDPSLLGWNNYPPTKTSPNRRT